MNSTNEIIFKCTSMGTILNELYKMKKRIDKKYTIQFICNKIGMRSKGQLADVFAGRRHLSESYLPSVADIFGLNSKQKRALGIQLKFEKEKNPIRKAKLYNQLVSVKKSLMLNVSLLEGSEFNPFLLVKVFCSFGLFDTAVNLGDLQKMVDAPQFEIQRALRALSEQGWIVEKNGYFSVTENQVLFNESDQKQFHLKLIMSCLDHVRENIETLFENRNETFIESSMVSVKREKYINKLPEIKVFFDEAQSELETDFGDDIVHFNIQIYPDS